MTTLGIIQCRFASTRLPGKALRPLAGRPVLDWVVLQARRARRLDALVLATTINREDDAIAEAGARLGVPVLRGPCDDVLARYVMALDAFPHRRCVRITADNPLTLPALVDAVVDAAEGRDLDYAYMAEAPYGAGADCFRASALRIAAAGSDQPRHREHVNTFFLDNHLFFAIGCARSPIPRPDIRVTLDTEADLARLHALFAGLDPLTADLPRVVAAWDGLPAELKAWESPVPALRSAAIPEGAAGENR